MRLDFRLTVNGKDQTLKTLGPQCSRLVSLSVRDAAGVKSDRLDLELVRGDERPPDAGSLIELMIGTDIHELTPMGQFLLDGVETSGGRSGYFIHLSATAAGMQGRIKNKRTESYHQITLGELARTIAGRGGLEASVEGGLAEIQYNKLYQTGESDMNLLTRLMGDLDGFFKVADGKLIITKSRTGIRAC